MINPVLRSTRITPKIHADTIIFRNPITFILFFEINSKDLKLIFDKNRQKIELII